MDILTLLRKKNDCLRKFYDLSLAFASEPELERLQRFQQRREATLKAVELFDRKITETVSALNRVERTSELIESVKMALSEKDDLVHRILEVDLRIIGWIENARGDVMRDLVSIGKSRRIGAKFKSTWIPDSGDSLDKKL